MLTSLRMYLYSFIQEICTSNCFMSIIQYSINTQVVIKKRSNCSCMVMLMLKRIKLSYVKTTIPKHIQIMYM